MRSLLNRSLLIGALALLPLGCGPARSGGPFANEPATVLSVENQSTSDITIYAVSGGQRIRLGDVTGVSTQNLTIPQRVVGVGREIAFEADPLAGAGSVTTYSIYVVPGEQVELTIPSSVR